MDATTSYDILVIMLSVMLAIFLVLGIVAMFFIIKILKNVRVITEKAEKIADKAEHITEFFENTAGPVAIGRLLGNITDMFKNKNSKR
ncbi:hypothetical protein E6P97_00605 [Patescibacteria group bacterium]|nr:MAG: hypothetical protein E6P97_00605 [Patescibacteria group bacterium]